MPRRNRHGYYGLVYGNRNLLNQFMGYNLKNLYQKRFIQPLYKQDNTSKHKRYRNRAKFLDLSNLRKFKSINLKIEEINKKIKEEFDSRREYIRKFISKDEDCFILEKNQFLRLNKNFLNYLVKKSKSKFLKKGKSKKDLKKIRINLEEGKEDILIYSHRRNFFGSDQLKSVLKADYSKWKKWGDIIHLIGRNIKDFKLSIKKRELKNLYSEYERITFLKKEENIKICEKCGIENLRKAIYCHNCGNKL
ncbi:MAG: hypothetical protein ACFFAH_12790 [Promethearchaeota archaeon]